MVNKPFRPLPKLERRPRNLELEREMKIINSIHIPNCFIPIDVFDFNAEVPYLRQTDPRCPLPNCNIIQPTCPRCPGRMKRRGRYIF
jgi:hypothetical protein